MGPFEIGDVVVCVNAKPCPVFGPTSYVEGALYRVEAIKTGACKKTRMRGTGIKCCNMGERWRRADCFRKLPKADETFAAQMRALKPVRVQA